jgi:hypothetical protein
LISELIGSYLNADQSHRPNLKINEVQVIAVEVNTTPEFTLEL